MIKDVERQWMTKSSTTSTARNSSEVEESRNYIQKEIKYSGRARAVPACCTRVLSGFKTY